MWFLQVSFFLDRLANRIQIWSIRYCLETQSLVGAEYIRLLHARGSGRICRSCAGAAEFAAHAREQQNLLLMRGSGRSCRSCAGAIEFIKSEKTKQAWPQNALPKML